MKKAAKVIKNKEGNFALISIAIVLLLLLISAGIFEYIRLQIVAQGVRDAVQTSITTVCTQNYANVYNGVREGYSGGYSLSNNGEWTETVAAGDIYSQLDSLLKTQEEGAYHVKYSGNAKEFSLSDLSVQMTNTPFAPANPDKETKFTGIAYITVTVPLSFGWSNLPPLQIHLKVTGGYTSKY